MTEEDKKLKEEKELKKLKEDAELKKLEDEKLKINNGWDRKGDIMFEKFIYKLKYNSAINNFFFLN